jgi:hypothetical protein
MMGEVLSLIPGYEPFFLYMVAGVENSGCA